MEGGSWGRKRGGERRGTSLLFNFWYECCPLFLFVAEMVILGGPRRDSDPPNDEPESLDPPLDEHPELSS